MNTNNVENTHFSGKTTNPSNQIQSFLEAVHFQNEPTSSCIITVTKPVGEDFAALASYHSAFCQSMSEKSDTKSALYVQTCEGSTPKSLIIEILKEFNQVLPNLRTPEYVFGNLLFKNIKNDGVQALFIDDIQHLMQTQNQARYLSDWFKYLADNSDVLIVLGGPADCFYKLGSNEQFQRRVLANF